MCVMCVCMRSCVCMYVCVCMRSFFFLHQRSQKVTSEHALELLLLLLLLLFSDNLRHSVMGAFSSQTTSGAP